MKGGLNLVQSSNVYSTLNDSTFKQLFILVCEISIIFPTAFNKSVVERAMKNVDMLSLVKINRL